MEKGKETLSFNLYTPDGEKQVGLIDFALQEMIETNKTIMAIWNTYKNNDNPQGIFVMMKVIDNINANLEMLKGLKERKDTYI